MGEGTEAKLDITFTSVGTQHTYSWRELAIWTIIFAGVAVILSTFIDHEPGAVVHRLQAMSEYFAGGPKPEVVTYPIWGLALLLWLVPSVPAVMVLQILIGSFAAAALFLRLRNEFTTAVKPLALLFLCVLPWFVVVITPYPQGLAAALAVLAILCVERAWRHGRWVDWVAAGVLFGLAQNFRSELVLLPLFCMCLLIVLRPIRPWRPVRVLGYVAIIALLFQVPWSLFYYQETGRPKLTESTGWAAMYGALGQLPDNPWGIEYNDAFLDEVIQQEGHSFSWVSDQAGEVFRAKFLAAVREEPTALVRVWGYRIKSTLIAPLNTGEISLSADQAKQLDVLKEKLKLALGVAPNQRQIVAYQQSGLWDTPAAPTVMAAFAFQVAGQGIFAVFFLATLAGLARALFSGMLSRRDSILLPLLACPIMFKLLLGVFLSARSDYMNGIALFCIPFVLIAIAQFPGERGSKAT